MGDVRPLDRQPYFVNHDEHLDRVLNRPQLTGIGISGCIGIGIFVTSGSIIATSGSLGGPISYLIAGGISACVLYTLTEMVSSRPLTGALIDLPHHFLDPAAGFAVAVSYSLANILSMATLTGHSAELTALLKDKPEPHPVGVEVAINLALIALTTISHCLGVKLYGRIERVIAAFKLCLFILVCVMMLVINVGGAGPRQGSYRGNYTDYAFPPGFKPTGFDGTKNSLIQDKGVPDTSFGMPGPGGRLFGLLTSITLAMFSCIGGEVIAMTAGEAREPFKDVPIVMSFVYLVPLSLYPLTLMSAAANVNYTDRSLPLVWNAGAETVELSPFIIAIQTSAISGLAKALQLFFIISSYTAANTELYVASRSVFMLAQTYMPRRLAGIFGKTNNGHTPLAAILLCSAFGFISLSGLSRHAYNQPRQTMAAFFTSSVSCIYICECITFLRFRAGLERLERRKVLSRNDPLYISKMFKSRWQPLPAYIGIIGCSFVVLWSGIPPLYILGSKNGLTSTTHLKSSVGLAFDVLGAYLGPLLFATCYLVYKYITPGTLSVDICNMTTGDYVLPNIYLIEAEDHRRSSRQSSGPVNDPNIMELGVQLDAMPSNGAGNGRPTSMIDVDELSPEMQEEYETNKAHEEERTATEKILKGRPPRIERGLPRELWSCLVADD